ncbi:MAG: hypothetical protein E6R04_01335 [Spirochaetes bacterium]|nr:MAG: hypothetical protein E6R04_01335 [Spirochaetota bacterium]
MNNEIILPEPKLYSVKVTYQRAGETSSAYDKVTLRSPWTGRTLTIAGFFDGDMCEDIRNSAALATNEGAREGVLHLTKADLYRWREAYDEMIRHYCD